MNLENALYRKTIVPMDRAYDGETPTLVVATEEVNCYAVWLTSYDVTELLKWIPKYNGREEAIEFAVAEAAARISLQKEAVR